MLGLYGVCGVVPLLLGIPSSPSSCSVDCEKLRLLRRGDISQPDPPYNEEDRRLFIYKLCARASVLKVNANCEMTKQYKNYTFVTIIASFLFTSLTQKLYNTWRKLSSMQNIHKIK
jgi:hypothetical protein